MRWLGIFVAAGAWAQGTPAPVRDAMRAAAEKQQAAAVQQREAVRKQAESAGVWLPPRGGTEPVDDPAGGRREEAPSPACEALSDEATDAIVKDAAKAQELEAKLLRAVIEQESARLPCAVSPKGAKGLMQLMPETAKDLGVKDAFDPRENVEAGARYLKQLLNRYKSDLSQALGAYNAGPAAVDQAGGIPNIRETREYVQSVLKRIGATRTDPPKSPPPKPTEN